MPLQRDADLLAVGGVLDELDWLGVERGLGPVEVLHERGDPALEAELLLAAVALVVEANHEPRVEECQLAQPLHQ